MRTTRNGRRRMLPGWSWLAPLVVLASGQAASAQSTETETDREEPGPARQEADPAQEAAGGGFGAPDTVQNQLEGRRHATGVRFEFDALNPYYEWKEHLHEEYGYSFGATYYAVGLKAGDSLSGADDYATGGVFRYFGEWELFGRGTGTTGTLIYLIEHRDAFSDGTPSELSFANLGNVGAIEIPFNDEGWHLTNLFWAQTWSNKQFELWVGYLDITDYVDVYPLTSPWNDFSNFAFSIGTGTIDLPDDAALGFAAGGWLTDSVYLLGGLNDLNADPTEPEDAFDTFFNDHEYFTHVEIGYTGAGQEEYFLDNVHLTLWHADERDDLGVESGWGMVGSLTRRINENWLYFIRGGFSEDGGGLLQRAVSVGGSWHAQPIGWPGDQLGFGLHWGQPNEDLFGSGLDDQYASEVYYRLQVSREIAIAPNVQVLVDPAFNSDDTIWVAGVRASFGL